MNCTARTARTAAKFVTWCITTAYDIKTLLVFAYKMDTCMGRQRPKLSDASANLAYLCHVMSNQPLSATRLLAAPSCLPQMVPRHHVQSAWPGNHGGLVPRFCACFSRRRPFVCRGTGRYLRTNAEDQLRGCTNGWFIRSSCAFHACWMWQSARICCCFAPLGRHGAAL